MRGDPLGETVKPTDRRWRPAMSTPPDPFALLRTRKYVVLLVVAAILGVPISVAAYFFLWEAMGLGGPTATLVLLPGLLAGGIGFLVFIGIDTLTGLGVSTLSIPDLPPFTKPDVAEFGWAIVIAVAAVILGSAIRWLGL